MDNNWLHLFSYQLSSELRSRYVGSIFGILWAFLSPLLQMGMYVFLFMVVFKVRLKETGSSVDYVLFVLSAMIGWLPFQESLMTSASSISKNGSIIKNVCFPKELFPISIVLCSLITLGVGLAIYIVFFIGSGNFFKPCWLFLPILILAQLLFSMALGFLNAVIGAFYKDIMIILPILLQFFLIGTPIFYGIEDLPQGIRFLAYFNPLTYLFKGYRDVLFYGVWPDFISIFIFLAASFLLMIWAFKFFKKVDGYFEAVV